MSPAFVHLHLHSEYALTDSTVRLKELARRCVALGQPAVAVTDPRNRALMTDGLMASAIK